MITKKRTLSKNRNVNTKNSRKKNRRLKIYNKKNSRPLHSKKKKKQTERTHKQNQISTKINVFLGKLNLDEIARKTAYLIRSSPIIPFIFVYSLSMGLFGCGEISLDMLAININDVFGTDLTGSAFCQRMKEKKSVFFLKSCFEKLLAIQLESSFDNQFNEVFSMFKGVILEDSTGIELNKKAKRKFKGCGGLCSKSSLKLNWVFNLCCYSAIAVDIFSGNVPDQKNAKKSLKYFKKGMLIIRDLGYFSISTLASIHTKGAYYLSRLHKNVCVYKNQEDDIPVDMPSFLKRITIGNKSAKIPIFIGQEDRLSVQLIVQKVPIWVYRQRLKKYKKKIDGKALSNDFIELAKYSIFITNVPDELWISKHAHNGDIDFAKYIVQIYKMRWQIELLFKKFKSKTKLHIIKGKDGNPILCLIYGRLIALILSLMILSFAAKHHYKGRETSLWKVATWLTSRDRLANAILNGNFYKLYDDFFKHFKLLCKNKRKRETALEEIQKALDIEKLAA